MLKEDLASKLSLIKTVIRSILKDKNWNNFILINSERSDKDFCVNHVEFYKYFLH